jgi:hypothetical protein
MIKDLSQSILDVLLADAGLAAYRQAYRGDGKTGVTEWRPSMPDINNGVFEVQDADAPYLAVTRSGENFVTQSGESFSSELTVSRRVLGILSTNPPSYERDEEVKGFYLAVWRAVFSDAMRTALAAGGVKRHVLFSTDVDGLSESPQAAFVMDIALTIDGSALMV